MRKRKNMKQENVFVRFMKEHPNLARGFAKGDKTSQEELWTKLTSELNVAGPPTKESAYWKKTWLDWKTNIKRKLSHNKKEIRQTGGGNYNQYILSQLEEEVAVVCGLYQTVDGIKAAKSFGVPTVEKDISDHECNFSSDSVASSSSSSTHSQSPLTSTPKKRTRINSAGNQNQKKIKNTLNLEELIDNENHQLQSIGINIEKLSQIKNDEQPILKSIENKLDTIGNKFDSICTNLENIGKKYDNIGNKLDVICTNLENNGKKYDAMIALKTKELEETNRHNILSEKHDIRMQRNAVSKLETKIKAIGLKQLKFDALSGSTSKK